MNEIKEKLDELRTFIYENGAFDWLGTGSSWKLANQEETEFWKGIDERIESIKEVLDKA